MKRMAGTIAMWGMLCGAGLGICRGQSAANRQAGVAQLPDITVVGKEAGAMERADTTERMDALRLNSPNPLVGASREEFTRWTRSIRLGDIVDRMPEVYSGGDEHLGENKDTRIRGLKHGWTRMEYGGVMLPDISPGRDFRLNKLSPLSVGSVVVLRSPPPEYDSDGIAGRIVLTPRPIPEKAYLETQLGSGLAIETRSDQEAVPWNLAVATGTRVGDGFGYNLFGNVDRTPFVSQTRTLSRTSAGELTKDKTSEEDKYWDTANAVADFGFLYDRGEIRLRPMYLYMNEVRATEATTSEPGKNTKKEVTDLERPQSIAGVSLTHAHHFTDRLALEWDAHYFVATEEKYTDKDVLSDSGDGFDFVETQSNQRDITHWVAQAGAKATYRFDFLVEHEFKTGFQLRQRDFDSDYDKWETDPAGVVADTTDWEDNFELREDYVALFAQDTLKITERLNVMAGARCEYANTETWSTFNDQHGQSDTADLNPSLHAVYRLTDHLNLRGSIARMINRPGYRDMAPTEEEEDDTITLGNPDLVPQTAWNGEWGLEFTFGKSLLGVAAFYKDIADVIETVDTGEDVDGKDVLQFDNIGDGYVRGIAFDQRLAMGDLSSALDGLTLWANETVLDSEVRDELTGIKRPFSEQSDLLLGLGASYEMGKTGTILGLGAKYQGESEKISSATDKTTTEEVWYANAQISQRIGKNSRLVFSVENLLDEQIKQHRVTSSGTEDAEDSVGRTFNLSLAMTF